MNSVVNKVSVPHPFWSIAFRPFFFLGILQALVASVVWTLYYSGWIQISFPYASSFTWHAATMVYGFVFNIFVGFLLTATAKWTNTKALSGTILKWYFFASVVAQILWFLPSLMPQVYYQFFFLAVYAWLAIFLIQLFIKTKNYKNLIVAVPMGILALGVCFTFSKDVHLSSVWILIALGCIRTMLVIIAGRVIPFFSKMALLIEVKPPHKRSEVLLILLMMVLIFEPLFEYAGKWGSMLWVVVTGLAIILNLYRMTTWPIKKALSTPILFVLYVGYVWIIIHLIMNLAIHFNKLSALGKPSVHALTYGAIGIMIVAMVSRVSLGHTGRAIKASSMMIASYYSIGIGAVVRVFAPLVAPSYYLQWIELSGILWFLSFALLAIEVWPMLFTPRPDEV